MSSATFDWDSRKNRENVEKHGVAFADAQRAFGDPKRVIAEDTAHSRGEQRFFCFGLASGGVLTVRFTWRANVIRICGAGYGHEGKSIYEHENQIPR